MSQTLTAMLHACTTFDGEGAFQFIQAHFIFVPVFDNTTDINEYEVSYYCVKHPRSSSPCLSLIIIL